MSDLSDLPKTLQRWCCSWGKSCGLTTLDLRVESQVIWDGPTPKAILIYGYYRDNDDCRFYSADPDQLLEWITETELDPEEVRKHNEAYGRNYE